MNTARTERTVGSISRVAPAARVDPLATSACVVTVDLAAVVANWRAVAALVAPAECAAVVKADAYGLGAVRVVPALASAGCATFFVATIDEAAEVRALAPDARVYVLDGLLPGAAAALAASGARPVLGSLDEVREWAAHCRTARRRLPAAIHVDSGMNRLGLEAGEIDAVLSDPGLLQALELDFLMSHLASSDDSRSAQNRAQLRRFLAIAGRFPQVKRSLAASGGVLLGRSYDFDLVRPGLLLFGGRPSQSVGAPVVPAVRVEARVLQVRTVERGRKVGYSAGWTAPRRSRIAVVALGYADAVPRTASASNDATGGFVAFRGRRAPMVGRISMDLVTVDVTDLKDAAPARGDLVEIIGQQISLEEAAHSFGTIPWEVLTRLSRRAARVYVEASSDVAATIGAPHHG